MRVDFSHSLGYGGQTHIQAAVMNRKTKGVSKTWQNLAVEASNSLTEANMTLTWRREIHLRGEVGAKGQGVDGGGLQVL